jgi:hypothetical protein
LAKPGFVLPGLIDVTESKLEGEARTQPPAISHVPVQPRVFATAVGEPKSRNLREITHTVPHRRRGHRVAEQIAAADGAIAGAWVDVDLRIFPEEAGEPVHPNDVEQYAPSQVMASEAQAAVVARLVIVLKNPNWG